MPRITPQVDKQVIDVWLTCPQCNGVATFDDCKPPFLEGPKLITITIICVNGHRDYICIKEKSALDADVCRLKRLELVTRDSQLPVTERMDAIPTCGCDDCLCEA